MKAEHRKQLLAQLRLLRNSREEITHMHGIVFGVVIGLHMADAITWEEAERLRHMVSNAAEWAKSGSRQPLPPM